MDDAQAKLWSYYLEWSKIARARIKDGRLLQLLGFVGRRETGASGDSTRDDGGEPE